MPYNNRSERRKKKEQPPEGGAPPEPPASKAREDTKAKRRRRVAVHAAAPALTQPQPKPVPDSDSRRVSVEEQERTNRHLLMTKVPLRELTLQEMKKLPAVVCAICYYVLMRDAPTKAMWYRAALQRLLVAAHAQWVGAQGWDTHNRRSPRTADAWHTWWSTDVKNSIRGLLDDMWAACDKFNSTCKQGDDNNSAAAADAQGSDPLKEDRALLTLPSDAERKTITADLDAAVDALGAPENMSVARKSSGFELFAPASLKSDEEVLNSTSMRPFIHGLQEEGEYQVALVISREIGHALEMAMLSLACDRRPSARVRKVEISDLLSAKCGTNSVWHLISKVVLTVYGNNSQSDASYRDLLNDMLTSTQPALSQVVATDHEDEFLKAFAEALVRQLPVSLAAALDTGSAPVLEFQRRVGANDLKYWVYLRQCVEAQIKVPFSRHLREEVQRAGFYADVVREIRDMLQIPARLVRAVLQLPLLRDWLNAKAEAPAPTAVEFSAVFMRVRAHACANLVRHLLETRPRASSHGATDSPPPPPAGLDKLKSRKTTIDELLEIDWGSIFHWWLQREQEDPQATSLDLYELLGLLCELVVSLGLAPSDVMQPFAFFFPTVVPTSLAGLEAQLVKLTADVSLRTATVHARLREAVVPFVLEEATGRPEREAANSTETLRTELDDLLGEGDDGKDADFLLTAAQRKSDAKQDAKDDKAMDEAMAALAKEEEEEPIDLVENDGADGAPLDPARMLGPLCTTMNSGGAGSCQSISVVVSPAALARMVLALCNGSFVVASAGAHPSDNSAVTYERVLVYAVADAAPTGKLSLASCKIAPGSEFPVGMPAGFPRDFAPLCGASLFLTGRTFARQPAMPVLVPKLKVARAPVVSVVKIGKGTNTPWDRSVPNDWQALMAPWKKEFKQYFLLAPGPLHFYIFGCFFGRRRRPALPQTFQTNGHHVTLFVRVLRDKISEALAARMASRWEMSNLGKPGFAYPLSASVATGQPPVQAAPPTTPSAGRSAAGAVATPEDGAALRGGDSAASASGWAAQEAHSAAVASSSRQTPFGGVSAGAGNTEFINHVANLSTTNRALFKRVQDPQCDRTLLAVGCDLNRISGDLGFQAFGAAHVPVPERRDYCLWQVPQKYADQAMIAASGRKGQWRVDVLDDIFWLCFVQTGSFFVIYPNKEDLNFLEEMCQRLSGADALVALIQMPDKGKQLVPRGTRAKSSTVESLATLQTASDLPPAYLDALTMLEVRLLNVIIAEVQARIACQDVPKEVVFVALTPVPQKQLRVALRALAGAPNGVDAAMQPCFAEPVGDEDDAMSEDHDRLRRSRRSGKSTRTIWLRQPHPLNPTIKVLQVPGVTATPDSSSCLGAVTNIGVLKYLALNGNQSNVQKFFEAHYATDLHRALLIAGKHSTADAAAAAPRHLAKFCDIIDVFRQRRLVDHLMALLYGHSDHNTDAASKDDATPRSLCLHANARNLDLHVMLRTKLWALRELIEQNRDIQKVFTLNLAVQGAPRGGPERQPTPLDFIQILLGNEGKTAAPATANRHSWQPNFHDFCQLFGKNSLSPVRHVRRCNEFRSSKGNPEGPPGSEDTFPARCDITQKLKPVAIVRDSISAAVPPHNTAAGGARASRSVFLWVTADTSRVEVRFSSSAGEKIGVVILDEAHLALAQPSSLMAAAELSWGKRRCVRVSVPPHVDEGAIAAYLATQTNRPSRGLVARVRQFNGSSTNVTRHRDAHAAMCIVLKMICMRMYGTEPECFLAKNTRGGLRRIIAAAAATGTGPAPCFAPDTALASSPAAVGDGGDFDTEALRAALLADVVGIVTGFTQGVSAASFWPIFAAMRRLGLFDSGVAQLLQAFVCERGCVLFGSTVRRMLQWRRRFPHRTTLFDLPDDCCIYCHGAADDGETAFVDVEPTWHVRTLIAAVGKQKKRVACSRCARRLADGRAQEGGGHSDLDLYVIESTNLEFVVPVTTPGTDSNLDRLSTSAVTDQEKARAFTDERKPRRYEASVDPSASFSARGSPVHHVTKLTVRVGTGPLASRVFVDVVDLERMPGSRTDFSANIVCLEVTCATASQPCTARLCVVNERNALENLGPRELSAISADPPQARGSVKLLDPSLMEGGSKLFHLMVRTAKMLNAGYSFEAFVPHPVLDVALQLIALLGSQESFPCKTEDDVLKLLWCASFAGLFNMRDIAESAAWMAGQDTNHRMRLFPFQIDHVKQWSAGVAVRTSSATQSGQKRGASEASLAAGHSSAGRVVNWTESRDSSNLPPIPEDSPHHGPDPKRARTQEGDDDTDPRVRGGKEEDQTPVTVTQSRADAGENQTDFHVLQASLFAPARGAGSRTASAETGVGNHTLASEEAEAQAARVRRDLYEDLDG